MSELLPGRAVLALALVVIVEVVARECTVGVLEFVKRGNVRPYPVLNDEPVEHRCRAVGCITDQPGSCDLRRVASRKLGKVSLRTAKGGTR
jgi:hypothetical protein